MTNQFRSPPLDSVTAALHFESQGPWDPMLFSEYYSKISSWCSERIPMSRLEINLSGPGAQTSMHDGAAMQFLDQERSLMLELYPNQLNIKRVRGYLGWERFRGEIAQAVSPYIDVAQPSSIVRLQLIYLNIVSGKISPGSSFLMSAKELITLSPSASGQLLGASASAPFITGVHYEGTSGNHRLRIEVVSLSQASTDTFSVGFTLDCVLAHPLGTSAELSAKWFDDAHAFIEAAFQTLITKKARDLFSEVDV